MTDTQFIAWLKDSAAIRCVLVEADVRASGAETTRFLSNRVYVTSATDAPANTSYKPCVVGGVQFTETLSLEGTVSLSYGDIELDNLSGERDSWLGDVWANRTLKVYIGDATWVRSEFRLVFDGVISAVDTKNRGRVNIRISDKLQRLNAPVTETKLGGTTSNAERLIPLTFGECHNVSPLLVAPSVNEYQVHDGAIESIIEVRDNGVPVAFTPYLATGKFRLTSQPVGQITCSAQGAKISGAYANTVGPIIRHIATTYGSASLRLSVGDIDTAAFTAFEAANTQSVGLYLSDRANVVEVLNRLSASVGGRVFMNRGGKLAILKVTLPQTSSGTIGSADIVAQSLAVNGLPTVKAAVQVGYCKNWTVQNGSIAAGVPTSHAELYKQEWLTVTSKDAATASNYKTFTEPVMEETLLLTSTDATAEAVRRVNMWNVQRRAYKCVGMPWMLLTDLGSGKTIQNNRFGLSAGQTGQVISVQTDWLNPRVTMEIIV